MLKLITNPQMNKGLLAFNVGLIVALSTLEKVSLSQEIAFDLAALTIPLFAFSVFFGPSGGYADINSKLSKSLTRYSAVLETFGYIITFAIVFALIIHHSPGSAELSLFLGIVISLGAKMIITGHLKEMIQSKNEASKTVEPDV